MHKHTHTHTHTHMHTHTHARARTHTHTHTCPPTHNYRVARPKMTNTIDAHTRRRNSSSNRCGWMLQRSGAHRCISPELLVFVFFGSLFSCLVASLLLVLLVGGVDRVDRGGCPTQLVVWLFWLFVASECHRTNEHFATTTMTFGVDAAVACSE